MHPTILKRDQVEVRRATTPNLDEGSSGATNVRGADGGPGNEANAPSCKKAVRLLEEQGVVHALELTCSCGEVTVVELHYPESAPQAAAPEES